MLFKLREPDYETEAKNDTPTKVYGRTPQEILQTLEYYKIKMSMGGQKREDPNTVFWMKRDFSEKDIEQKKRGRFHFFTGMIKVTEENKSKPLFEELKITEDFTVYVPVENIGYLAVYVRNIPNLKRGPLYKLENPIEAMRNRSFVPEDIAQALMRYDFSRYHEDVMQELEKRKEISQHPNVKILGLEEMLAAARAEATQERILQN